MPIEREAKFRVADHEAVRAALRAAGAVRIGLVLERNHILDRPDGELRLRGAALRLRSCDVIDGPTHPALLTYKGPGGASRFKSREELEVEVANADATLSILLAAGFVETIYYEKRRESWTVGHCKVELDELPELGLFVEIEGNSDEGIEQVTAQLGLAKAEHLDEGYLSLIACNRGRSGTRVIRAVF